MDGALVRGERSSGVSSWALALHSRVSYAGRKKKTRFSQEMRLCSWHTGLMPARVRSANTERSGGVGLFRGGVKLYGRNGFTGLREWLEDGGEAALHWVFVSRG